MIIFFVAGMLGVLLGLALFRLGQCYQKGEHRAVSGTMSEEEQRRMQQSLRELSNFYAYNGTAQEDADTPGRV